MVTEEVVVDRGGKEVKRRVEGEEEASALRRPFGRQSPGSSGALVVLVRYLPRVVDLCQCSPEAMSAHRTTITGKDGDDSQRVNRVTQACGTPCHFCCVWIPKRITYLRKNSKDVK